MSKAVRVFAVFATYTVAFFLSEYMLYDHFKAWFGQDAVSTLYAVSILVNGLGYLSFPLVRLFVRAPSVRTLCDVGAVLVFAVSALGLTFSESHSVAVLFAFACMFAGGYMGGELLWAASRALDGSPHIGKIYACGVSAATLVQYLVQNYASAANVQTGVVVVCAVVYAYFIWLLKLETPSMATPQKTPKSVHSHIITAAVMTVLFTVLYGTADGIIVKLSSEGRLDLAASPRLIYAVSLLLAGFVADLGGRKYMLIGTAALSLVFALAPLFLENDVSYNLYYAFVWLWCGFYAVYFSVVFMDIAPLTNFPELWAGMGRAVKAFVNCAIAIPSAVLFGAAGYGWVIYVNVAVLALMLIALYASRTPLRADEPEPAPENFMLSHNLTDKEKEVLAVLLSGHGKKTKEFAAELGMSERSFQRHLGSIYAKTATSSRAELVTAYHK